jgi:pilus assembly protein FimV
MPDESEFDALPPLSSDTDDSLSHDGDFEMEEPSTSGHLADELSTDAADDFAKPGFSDDPVDTKLDLARAYIDMGDHEGARAMLHEAMHEGSQIQKEAAQKLLDELD